MKLTLIILLFFLLIGLFSAASLNNGFKASSVYQNTNIQYSRNSKILSRKDRNIQFSDHLRWKRSGQPRQKANKYKQNIDHKSYTKPSIHSF
jgi:hypothetical protein